MFCKICGKMIAENALFCTFCGTPVSDNAPNEAEAKSAEPIISAEIAATEMHPAPEQTISTESPSVTEPATTTYEPVAPTAEPAAASVPMQHNSAVTQGAAFEYSIEPPAPQPKEQKYYTLGHIIACLVAVGVMSIVAGVFAGLYFSVI